MKHIFDCAKFNLVSHPSANKSGLGSSSACVGESPFSRLYSKTFIFLVAIAQHRTRYTDVNSCVRERKYNGYNVFSLMVSTPEYPFQQPILAISKYQSVHVLLLRPTKGTRLQKASKPSRYVEVGIHSRKYGTRRMGIQQPYCVLSVDPHL